MNVSNVTKFIVKNPDGTSFEATKVHIRKPDGTVVTVWTKPSN